MSTTSLKLKRLLGCLPWCVLLAVVLGIFAMLGETLQQYDITFTKKVIEEKQEPEETSVAVRTMTVAPRNMPDTITIPGKLEGLVEAVLGAEKPGRITKLLADKGETISKGQRLMQLDDRIWKSSLDQAEIQCREADKDLKRWEELEKAGAVSAKDFDDIQTRKEIADVTRDQARVAVKQCQVRSPIDGIVADRFIERGEYANEGQAVFVVVDLSQVKIVIDIPERDIFSVELGKPIDFTVDAVGDDVFTGEVSFIAPIATRENNAFKTEILIDNAEGLLKPGMIANVRVVRSTREHTVVVPLAAVIPKKGEHVVFVATGDRAERRTVKIDAIIKDEVILSSGVDLGEQVIIEGHRALADGMLLELKGGDTHDSE